MLSLVINGLGFQKKYMDINDTESVAEASVITGLQTKFLLYIHYFQTCLHITHYLQNCTERAQEGDFEGNFERDAPGSLNGCIPGPLP